LFLTPYALLAKIRFLFLELVGKAF